MRTGTEIVNPCIATNDEISISIEIFGKLGLTFFQKLSFGLS